MSSHLIFCYPPGRGVPRSGRLGATRPTRNHDRDVAGGCRGFSLKTSVLYPWHEPHSKYRHEKQVSCIGTRYSEVPDNMIPQLFS
jgi:hypothetical protein